ncbi:MULTISPECIES: hypothetical protein [Deefgea]|uniref:XRE family transcriptional regulator n=1 Tax=Deefgea chitinilytica TaxID=570276 RepID=A0ABS2CD69_9NEIS|nr:MULTISPECIES: hypothetical protein [Deefgea]MBM5572103.1 hypothetical protein [Deefgea chitinilytica]MBM9889338.1 hypothetical protein [Deefgea sp. CFH1-16]
MRIQTAQDLIAQTEALAEPIANPEFFIPETGQIRWVDALRDLQTASGLVEDKDFAAYLLMAPSSLSELLRGKVEPNARVKLLILNHLGFYTIQSALFFLMNDEHAASLQRAAQRQAKKIANQNSEKISNQTK